jgi:hypothetical protein
VLQTTTLSCCLRLFYLSAENFKSNPQFPGFRGAKATYFHIHCFSIGSVCGLFTTHASLALHISLMPDPRASWRILSELKRRSSEFRFFPRFTTAKLPASYLLAPPPLQRKTYLAVSTCSTTTSEVPVFNGCVFMDNLTPSSAKTHRPSH